MGRFLLKAAFGSEVLIRGQRGALRADAYKRKCVKSEDAQYSKKQNKLCQCWI